MTGLREMRARAGVFGRRGVRAVLLVLAAAAACLGLATATVADRPAAVADMSTLCVAAITATTDAADTLVTSAVSDAGSGVAHAIGVVLVLAGGFALALLVVLLRRDHVATMARLRAVIAARSVDPLTPADRTCSPQTLILRT